MTRVQQALEVDYYLYTETYKFQCVCIDFDNIIKEAEAAEEKSPFPISLNFQ